MSTISLRKLHKDLACMTSEDCNLQLLAGFQECMQQLAYSGEVVSAVAVELTAISGALNLVMKFLDAAHDQVITGDSLHCLLTPLHEKMQQSLTALDEVL